MALTQLNMEYYDIVYAVSLLPMALNIPGIPKPLEGELSSGNSYWTSPRTPFWEDARTPLWDTPRNSEIL